jgi:hypothetical protein
MILALRAVRAIVSVLILAAVFFGTSFEWIAYQLTLFQKLLTTKIEAHE